MREQRPDLVLRCGLLGETALGLQRALEVPARGGTRRGLELEEGHAAALELVLVLAEG